jgi:hypothetical protein
MRSAVDGKSKTMGSMRGKRGKPSTDEVRRQDSDCRTEGGGDIGCVNAGNQDGHEDQMAVGRVDGGGVKRENLLKAMTNNSK